MGDSSSFNSLLDLVNNHLSKCNVQEGPLKISGSTNVQVPFNTLQNSMSDTHLLNPENVHHIPKYNASDSPIQKVLAEQISNMLKAKERKEQEEKERHEKESEKLRLQKEQNEYVIDLMPAIQKPQSRPKPVQEVLSTSSSFESLLIENLKYFDTDSSDQKKSMQEPELLPCVNDMSYILTQKVSKAKCSAFGKVITSRLKPTPAPYFKIEIPSKVKHFDFSTKSPCDLIKEKLRQPTSYNTYMNAIDILMKDCFID